MNLDVYWQAATGILSNVAGCFAACGLDPPADVYVARQGTAADDRCECRGQLVAIWQDSVPGQDQTWITPTGGVHRIGSCVYQVTASFRIRYSRCWPANVTEVSGRIALPTKDAVDDAARHQLQALHVLSSALYGGEAFQSLPDVGLDCDEVRVGRILPYTAGGCAGWASTILLTHDVGA